MRGILFTTCLTILVLVVLTASFLFYQQNLDEQGSMARLVSFDRMSDEFSLAEKGIRDVMEASDIIITVEGNTATIAEPLPNTNSEEFNSSISSWKIFVENNSEFSVELDISGLEEELPIYVNDARYSHYYGFGEDVLVVTNAGQIESYSVSLDMNVDGTIEPLENMKPGANSFRLSMHTNTDSYSGSWNLDFSDSSDISFMVNSGEASYIVVVCVGWPADPGRLDISNIESADMIVTTNMTFDTGPVVALLEQSINITEIQYNISRESSIRLA